MSKTKKALTGDAVIYARYSSHNQRDVSIEQQVLACRAHAAELGLTVTETYEDRAISGTTDRRPSFQRLMRDAEHGKFAYVLAWKSNRIGRNMMQAMVNEAKLNNCGVKVYYAEEDFDDSAAGRFALRSMMNVNQFYSDALAEDVVRGMMDNAAKCMSNGSLPLGYKRGEDGKIVLDEPKAAVVREIYNRVAAYEPFSEIARDLNARGMKTRTGSAWNKCSFKTICSNERYRGIYIFKDVRVEGGIPRIIEDDLWYKVQDICANKRNKKSGRYQSGREDYLLTGKLRCGHCGSYMIGLSGTSCDGKLHHYYTCHRHRTEHTCDKKAVRRDVIEPAVAQAIKMYCLTDEAISWIADSAVAYWNDHDRALNIEGMEGELAANKRSIDNLMRAIEAGIITDTTRARLLELEREQSQLTAKISSARSEIVNVNRDDLVSMLEMYRSGDVYDKEFEAELFRTFLIAVYLYDDNRLRLVFNFTGNHKTVEFPLPEEAPGADPDGEECSLSFLQAGPNKNNPNLFPIGDGFGLFVFFGKFNAGVRGR